MQTAIDVRYADTSMPLVQYALYQHNRRFPERGFVHGDVYDLARLITTAIPAEHMDRMAKDAVCAVAAAAHMLEPAIAPNLYKKWNMPDVYATVVLWLNALLVQQRLYAIHNMPISCMPDRCLVAWRAICTINWRAIFQSAIDALYHTYNTAPSKVSEAIYLLVAVVDDIAGSSWEAVSV